MQIKVTLCCTNSSHFFSPNEAKYLKPLYIVSIFFRFGSFAIKSRSASSISEKKKRNETQENFK